MGYTAPEGRIDKRPMNPQGRGHPDGFFAKTEQMAQARRIFFRSFLGGTFLVVLTIFGVFSIYWGSFLRVPAHPLQGWVMVRGYFVEGKGERYD